MFIRRKRSGTRVYLQIVENRWEGGRSRQRVIATLGREDHLQGSGQLERLAQSAAQFSDVLLLLDEQRSSPSLQVQRIGPVLIFERLWRETGCQAAVETLLGPRQFEFPVERALFLTVLHRLMVSGSDRSAEQWRRDYRIAGTERLQLHHLYRAMAWLGEPLALSEQADALPFAPRCTKDLLEEELFARQRDLFTDLELVFFDTTSIYFEGEGGETIGEYGHSKDHRPDRKQMVVGAVIDGTGRPIACELWPGNVTDVTTLIPVIDRLRKRFGIGRVCVVADRGMISRETVEQLEQRNLDYILGARMRRQKEVSEQVLSRAGRFRVVHPKGAEDHAPSPLKVKEVWVEERRYVVCFNEDQATKDAADRQAILASLEEQLKKGDKALVGNKGYRRYLKSRGKALSIDAKQVQADARLDGKWVLRTNTDLDAAEVALQYKQLWRVETLFRSAKSLLHTRPIFHKCDETIRGHVFCSFLALVLRQALQERLARHGTSAEWSQILRDLDALTEAEVQQDDKRFRLRSEASGVCGKVFQAVGVAMPPTLKRIAEVDID